MNIINSSRSTSITSITPTNIDLSTDFFQTREFAFYIRRYILQDEIKNVVSNYEPRAKVNTVNVTANPDNNSFSATVSFYIGNNTLPTSVNLILQRSR